MPEVVFRPEAEADIVSLYDYVADQSSLDVATGYISRIEAACLSLLTFPKRGRARNDILPGLRTIGFERRVTIVYRIVEDCIEIVAVVYGGRDFEGISRSRDPST